MGHGRRISALVAAAVALTLARPGGAVDEEEHVVVEEDDDEDDDGPGWFWMQGEVGYESLNLTTFTAEEDEDSLTAGLIANSGGGPSVAFGAGFRLLFLTLGGRLSTAWIDPGNGRDRYRFSTFDLELGLRFGDAVVQPYLVIGGGYAVLGGLGDAVGGVRRGLDVDGVNARAALGLDIELSETFTIGARGTGQLLFLSRRGVPVRDLTQPKQVDTLNQAKQRALEAEGSSAGSALGLTGVIGVRF